MPGLSAIVQLDGAPVDPRRLERCSGAAAHRGAVASAWREGPVALALLGPAGAPGGSVLAGPAHSPLSIVLCGHLYEREFLAGTVDTAADAGDAALVLAAYRRWGVDCVERLDGDFAFVLHDAARQRVVCARDALGMHPLCYHFDGDRLVAASEPRQVLAFGFAREPCEESIAAYLSTARHLYGGSRTFYRDVHRVEPGHLVSFHAGRMHVQRHWQLDPGRQIEERTDEDMAQRVRGLLADAVRRRVPARGPYSCALTGGFDSSSVAALCRRAVDERDVHTPLETFSFELRDAESDEPEIIDAVSQLLRTNHHHIYLDQDNVFEVLPEMLAACDEPTFDMGLLYLWRKKERASKAGVEVMLSGLGGDELFVGQYHFLSDLLRAMRLRELWAEVRGIYPVDRYTGRRTSLSKLLRAYVVGPLVPRGAKRLARRVLRGEGPVPPWVAPALAERVDLAGRIRQRPARLYSDAYRQDCYEVFQSSLVDVTLPLHEQLGAAFGIETRFPLLDRRVVEYLFAAPRDQKIRRGEVRGLQRRALKGILPAVVLERHIKKNLNPVLRRQQYQNFVVALERLFGSGDLRCERYLDRACLRRMYEDFLARRGGDGTMLPLWYAMNLERWLQGLEA